MRGTAFGEIDQNRFALQQTGKFRQVRHAAIPNDEFERACRSAFRQSKRDATADHFQPGTLRQSDGADDGELAVRGGQVRHVIFGHAGRPLGITYHHEKFIFHFASLERSDETDLPFYGRTGRLLVNFRAANRVSEDDVRSVHVKSIPTRPVVGQRTERFGTRVCKFALVVRPAGQWRRAELLLTLDGGVHAVFAVERHAARGNVTGGPTRRHAQQFRVEEHARVIADADGQALHRDIVAGKFRADARALKRKVLLQHTGMTRGPARLRDEEQTAVQFEKADSKAAHPTRFFFHHARSPSRRKCERLRPAFAR